MTPDLLGIIENLVAPLDAILARVWMLGPGDLCSSCPMRNECPDQTRCLHLEASVGLTARLDGPFRRFPVGARQVGRVVLERRPFVTNRDLGPLGLAEPLWLSMHRVESFAAVPLLRDGECAGVLALFARRALSEADVRGLAAGAQLLALAIAPRPRPAAGDTPGAVRSLAAVVRETIERTLEATRGRVSGPQGAARILGLKPTTLHSRMRKLGVRRPSR